MKILGALAVLNEGVIDWKLIGISIDDELAEELNEIDDIEAHFPTLLEAFFLIIKVYKILGNFPSVS